MPESFKGRVRDRLADGNWHRFSELWPLARAVRPEVAARRAMLKRYQTGDPVLTGRGLVLLDCLRQVGAERIGKGLASQFRLAGGASAPPSQPPKGDDDGDDSDRGR